MKNYFLYVLCIVLFVGCQDTKTKNTSRSKTKKNHKRINLNQADSASLKEKLKMTLAENQQKKTYRLDTISPVNQIHLKPFLEKYGEANPAHYAVISTRFGDIKIKLFRDTPWHRANFVHLTKLGYFNTTYFYRVDQGFVIQAGNSDNDITAKMRERIGDFLIPKEFSKQHLNNYGAVGMAKYTEQNVSKASSPFEFYIVMNKNGAHHLDFEHTVFGKVVEGMDVAEKISRVKTGEGEWPLQDVPITVKVLP